MALCFRGGFGRVLLRGDTKFSQSERLDGWDDNPRIRFLFGYEAMPNLRALADDPPASGWQPLFRPCRYEVKTQPWQRPDKVKEPIVKARGFENHRLCSEDVAEFRYQPTACKKSYRMIVVRKNISVEKDERLLFDRVAYFFFITNLWENEADELVWSANERCDQENLLAQLHGGVPALRAAVVNLESNGAYMVMTALAWNLKAWWALLLPEQPGRWQEKHQMEKRWALRLECEYLRASALPVGAYGSEAGVSLDVVESVSVAVLPPVGRLTVLTVVLQKSESGCSDPCRRAEPLSRKKGGA